MKEKNLLKIQPLPTVLLLDQSNYVTHISAAAYYAALAWRHCAEK